MKEKQESEKPDIRIRLFAFYKKKETNLEDVEGKNIFPTFTYVKRDKENQVVSFEKLSFFDKASSVSDVTSGLNMLHPEAKRFLSPSDNRSLKTYNLNKKLQDEVERSEWKMIAPKWVIDNNKEISGRHLIKEDGLYYFTFVIDNIGVSYFPTGITAIYIDIHPNFQITDDFAPTVGKMMINKFNQTYHVMKSDDQNRNNIFSRKFKKGHEEKQIRSVQDRLAENDASVLINGLCGEDTSFNGIVSDLLGEGYSFLMGDRFISSIYIKTKWENVEDTKKGPFNESNYIDLIRLSRGENDNYIPHSDQCKPEGKNIINTFENVIFSLSGEGIACWVKPKPGQTFLNKQFKQRFDNIYMQLFLLALHQRYALVSLAQQLSEIELPQEGSDTIEVFKDRSKSLHQTRKKVADFYLRAYFRQPAVLDNHQVFYQKLQDALGIANLLEEVQKSTEELDHLINSTYLLEQNSQSISMLTEIKKLTEKQESSTQTEINILKKIEDLTEKQENSARIELIFTLVVEAAALPYYSYNFLEHAIGMDDEFALYIAMGLSLVTVGCTIYRFVVKKKKNED